MISTGPRYDWLIIGGGIHAVHLAVRLLRESAVSPERVCMVDPHPTLLHQWRSRTSTTGMSHLRSPSVHHLDISPYALQDFAGHDKLLQASIFAPPYHQPSVDMFNSHCDWVIDQYGLADLHRQGWVQSITIQSDHIEATTTDKQLLSAKNIVLAIGLSELAPVPSWAQLPASHAQHIFDPELALSNLSPPAPIAVLGGGISAGHLALKLSKLGHVVHLISRHPLREHQFDSSPGWLGPKNMRDFEQEKNLSHRRKMITQARYRGSVPPSIRRAIKRAVDKKSIIWHQSEVVEAKMADSALSIRLQNQTTLRAQKIVLATGLTPKRPGGVMVDTLIEKYQLPCSTCGYPITDSTLQWHPHIYVTGALAELELGPIARNIAGARRAADRLAPAFAKTP